MVSELFCWRNNTRSRDPVATDTMCGRRTCAPTRIENVNLTSRLSFRTFGLAQLTRHTQLDFDDRSDPIDFTSLRAANTGFYFDPIGPPRAAALAKICGEIERQPLLHRFWTPSEGPQTERQGSAYRT